jgi:hypothetical protein
MVAWSTGDLTDITNVVSGLIQYALDHANPAISNVKIYCNSPDTARKHDGFCHLTLYLLHVGRDPYWRNTPVDGPRPQLNNAQPLSLNLSYLLTAWCDTDYASEQRAMSVALQAIHSQPIVTQKLIVKQALTQYLPSGEFTMSIEADTIEEMSRLWQAITAPIRLSALIRVGVVFIAPDVTPLPPPMPSPTVANVSVSPEPITNAATITPLLDAGGGIAFQPVLPTAAPAQVVATIGPLTVVGGGSLDVVGNELDQPAAARVFLSVPGTATEWDVTTPWRQIVPPPGVTPPGLLNLVLPASYANPASGLPAPPAATPAPGLYNLTVGSTAPNTRSNAIKLIIAPRVDGMTNPPQLNPDATGLYSITGAGFVPASTVLALGAVPLAATTTAPPGTGQFTVTAAGTGISFMLPNPSPPSGEYPVLIQVNGIAAAPGWVVVVK